MASSKGNAPDDGDELRRLFPSLSKNEYLDNKTHDELIAYLKANPKERSELTEALQKRGAICVVIRVSNPVVERCLRKLDMGATDCNSSMHHAVKNSIYRKLNACIEQSGDK